MDINLIKQILPHRYPFLLIDRVLKLKPGEKIIGIKNMTINEWFFIGHFPDFSVMPGVLIVEAMAQLGGILIAKSIKSLGKKQLVYLFSIKDAKFKKVVVPGDQIQIEVQLLKAKKTIFDIYGTVYVKDEIVAEAELILKSIPLRL